MRLLLARHGDTFGPGETCVQVGNRTDLPLVESGKLQAKALGEALVGTPIAAIYSGSLKRQKETAAIAAEAMNYRGEILTDTEALTEIDYGLWEGRTTGEIQQQWPEEYRRWQEDGIWAEGIFGERTSPIQDWLAELRYPSDATVLAIGSGGSIRMLDWKQGKLKTGHFCVLEIAEERASIICWNRLPTDAVWLA